MGLELHTTDVRVTRASDVAGRDLSLRSGNDEFGKVLSARPVNIAQRNANERAAGWNVLQGALQKQFATVGGGQLRRYEAYRTLQKTVDGMKASADQPTGDPILQATREQFEANAESNMRYLTVQHQFQQMNQQHSCLSNLMKARNDSVKASINEIK